MISQMSPEQIAASLAFGEICLVRGDDKTLSTVIRIGQSLEGDAVATWGHATIYGGDYDLISPEARVVIRRLFDYRSSTLKFWWPPGFKKDWPELIGDTRKMNRIADDAYLQLGRRYDYLGLIGQALRGLASRLGLPGFGNWLAGVFQRPSRWFCSEMVAYCYQRQFPDFCNGNKHPSPQDIDDWCVKAGWECMTVKVKAADTA